MASRDVFAEWRLRPRRVTLELLLLLLLPALALF